MRLSQLLLAPCAGSELVLLGGVPVLSLALLEALPPDDNRDVTRDEARLLALRWPLAAFVRDFCGAAAGVSFEAPPVRPEGCSLPALLAACRVLLIAPAGCVLPSLLLLLLVRDCCCC